jgi:hypothetical protein
MLAMPLGAPLVVVAIALFAYSVATFLSAGTPVPARKPTNMPKPHLSGVLPFQLGIAMWVNSVWLLLVKGEVVFSIGRATN